MTDINLERLAGANPFEGGLASRALVAKGAPSMSIN
jgi:hypothetical protein